jgi:hypothetical protein
MEALIQMRHKRQTVVLRSANLDAASLRTADYPHIAFLTGN